MIRSQASTENESSEVKILARGVQILQEFVPDNEWLSNQELAERTSLPRPTVSRLTRTLIAQGMLTSSSENGRYRLALSVLTLGRSLMASADGWSLMRPRLEKFVEIHGGVAVIARQNGLHMDCIEACHAERGLIRINIEKGSRLDLMRSAVGRAWYQVASEDERGRVDALLAKKYRNDPKQHQKIDEGLKTAALDANGIYLGLENLESGVNSLGTALSVDGRTSSYALGVAGTLTQYSETQLTGKMLVDFLELKKALEQNADRAGLTV